MVASWLGTKMASGRENYLRLLTPVGALHFGMACLFPRSLNLAAIDVKLVAVN